MVRPSPVLCSRLRFTTKQVGFGFYKGNKTGSVGAHTEYGGYVVDWRKVRNYNVPDLTDFQLTPYVSKTIGEKREAPKHTDVEVVSTGGPLAERLKPVLQKVQYHNPEEFERILRHQIQQRLESTDYAPTPAFPGPQPDDGLAEGVLETREALELPNVPEIQDEFEDVMDEKTELAPQTPAQKLKELRNAPRRFRESKTERRERRSVKEYRSLLTKFVELSDPIAAQKTKKTPRNPVSQEQMRLKALQMAGRLTV